MRSLTCWSSLSLLASQVVAVPAASWARDDTNYNPTYVSNKTRADAVKEAFQRGWDGYYKYAFPHDSLLPVSNGYEDDR